MIIQTLDAGFLLHGRHAPICCQIFDHIFGQFSDQGFLARVFGTENTVYSKILPRRRNRDGQIQFCSTTGIEKNGGENHVLKSHISETSIY